MGIPAQKNPRIRLFPPNSPYSPISCSYSHIPPYDVENPRRPTDTSASTQHGRDLQEDDASSDTSSTPEKTRTWTLGKVLRFIVALIAAGSALTLCVELPVYLRDAVPVSHAVGDLPVVTSISFSVPANSQKMTSMTLLSSQTTTSMTALRTTAVEEHPEPPLVPQRARDCGVFTMKCAGAEGACNNACYAINCLYQPYSTLRYIGQRYGDRARVQENEDLHNRGHAGVKVLSGDGGRRAICGQTPFSQKLRDPQVRANGYAFDEQYDTDEWPMASTIQRDFEPGYVRNTLRCMPKSENQRAGGQWGNFVSDSGDNLGKTCPGPLKRGDTARVEFDLNGADLDKVQYCLPARDCRNDGYQFHLSELVPPNYLGGRVDQPYNHATNNRYELTRTAPEGDEPEPAGNAAIEQCEVFVTFTTSHFAAEVFDRNKKAQGNISTRNLPQGTIPEVYVISGLDYPVTITVQAMYNETHLVDHDLNFRYGPLDMPNTLRSYEWNINSVGIYKDSWSGGHEYCYMAYNHRQGRGYWRCWFPC